MHPWISGFMDSIQKIPRLSSLPPSLVAKRAGVSYHKLWRILAGRVRANPRTILAVSEGLTALEEDCREARLEWLNAMMGTGEERK